MASLWRGLPRDSVIRKGLRISLIEGAVCGAMIAATETWLVPLLQQRLGVMAAVIAWLTIIPQIAMVSIGTSVRPIIDWIGGNRRTVLLGAAMGVLLLLMLAGAALLQGHSWAAPAALWVAITLGIVQTVMAPAWFAWMGDLVPRPMMGRYLSWRWRIFISVRLAVGLGFAQVLTHWRATETPWGLVAVFGIAALARAASFTLLARQPVLKTRPVLRGVDSNRGDAGSITFRDFLRNIHRTPLGRCTLVWGVLVFGLNVCGPFVAPYLLAAAADGGLELDPSTYWWLVNVGVITRLVVLELIGRLTDMVGASAVLRVGVIGLCVFPNTWCFTGDVRWLMGSEILTGASACAAECAIGVLLFTCNRDPLQRVRLIGFHTVVAGAAVVAGSLVGMMLLRLANAGEMPVLGSGPFRTVIMVSMVVRMPAIAMAVWLLPRVRSLDGEEAAGLWRMVPGSGVAETIRRGLASVFRRA
jgi:MFS family permease